MIAGTEGYAQRAADLLVAYESVDPAEKHRLMRHLLPDPPARLLDVGAGTGADAGWFAALGYQVVAVEPVRELREPGRELHPSPSIEWVDDSLPDLALVQDRAHGFDAILLTAVWMHLDEPQRRRAMPVLTRLLAGEGVLLMSLRHGPVPPGRRMFDVGADETRALAAAAGLRTVFEGRAESVQAANRAAGVTWTCLGFRS